MSNARHLIIPLSLLRRADEVTGAGRCVAAQSALTCQ
jgi:hypothetical protein